MAIGVGTVVTHTPSGSVGVVEKVHDHIVMQCATVAFRSGEYAGTSQRCRCGTLSAMSSADVAAKQPEPTIEAEGHGERDAELGAFVEDACQTVGVTEFRGSLRFPEGFRPDVDCKGSVRGAAEVLQGVAHLEFILEECEAVAENRLRNLSEGAARLDFDGAMAVAIYSYDLGFMSEAKGKDNFYFVFNDQMRKRQHNFVNHIRSYCFFFLTALERLAPFKGLVHRGVPESALPLVRESYLTGTEIFWSAVTSTTTSLGVAQEFARAGGVIFRIESTAGRSIKEYSAIPSEHEIILSPNTKFVVSKGCTEGSDGFFYVDMVQVNRTFMY